MNNLRNADLNEQNHLKRVNASRYETSRRRKNKKKIKITKKTAAVCVILLIFIGYFIVHMAKMEYEYWKLHSEQSKLEQQLEDEKLENSQLKDELSQSDKKSYIEYLAKKYLGLIYPDEKIYVPLEKEDNK